MGNSGSVSLHTEGSDKAAKSSFRSMVFKHRKSFRNGAATKGVVAVKDSDVNTGQPAPVDDLVKAAAPGAAAVHGGAAAAAALPVDIPAPSAPASQRVGPSGGDGGSGGGAEMPSSSLEPTYEEIRQGSVNASYCEAVRHSTLLLPVAASAAMPGGGRTAAGGGAGETVAAAGHAAAAVSASDGAAHPPAAAAAGSGAKSFFAKLSRGSAGKKSKKGKAPSKVEDTQLPGLIASPGEGDVAGHGVGESKRGSQTRSSGDKENLTAAAAGGVIGSGHRRAPSYDRQLPDIPIVVVSSDETIPKKRYIDEASPKQRRALPDIPHESPPAASDYPGGDRIYSAVTSLPDQQTAESGDATPDDSLYDILQRDENPASVKIKQLKLQRAVGGEDQYSKAIETPVISAAAAEANVESENTYCEADTVLPVLTGRAAQAVLVSLPGTEPPLSQQQQVHAVGSGSSAVVRRVRAGGTLGAAYEQIEPSLAHVTVASSGAAGTPTVTSPQATVRPTSLNAYAAGGHHGLAPYSAVKPVRGGSERPRSLGARALHSGSGADAGAAELQPPPVPVKLFSFNDELTSYATEPMAAAAAAVPLVLMGGQPDGSIRTAAGMLADVDDENEVYSEPIEAAIADGATYAPHGDLPANYDILTIRPPLSAFKERLASGEGQVAEEEDDYYESVDKVEATLHAPAAVMGLAVSSSSPVATEDVESEASDLYAVPSELESSSPPQQRTRQKLQSAYEEIVLPHSAAVSSAEPTSHRSMGLVANGDTGAEASVKPSAAGQTGATASPVITQSDSSGQRHSAKPSRRNGYEQVDLPVTVVDQPRMLVGSTVGQTVATVDTVDGGMVIPPSPSDRPLALPLAARTRLAHHYDEVDDRGSDEASRSVAAAKSMRLHHHYDEIDVVWQSKT